MKLHEFAQNHRPILLEGGNVVINGQAADRIDAKARKQAVPIIDSSLGAINAAFAQFSGQPLWHPELLASRHFLSGSAFHFFDRANISDLKFVAAKPTVGDIDTQVDAEMREDIIAWLKQLPAGSRLGDAVYIGFKDDPLALGGSQLITLWNFPGIQVKIPNPDKSSTVRGCNIQIDLELKEFEVSPGTNYRQPTRWSHFSASSSWQDLSAGVKGVFHKYLIMALARLTDQEIVIRKPTYNRRTKQYDSYTYSEPRLVPMFTFAVGSREGGGLRPTYTPVLDSQGRQEQQDGYPVYDQAKTTGYVRDVDQIFANLFGKRIKKGEFKKLSSSFDSFTGLLNIMRGYLTQEEKQRVANKFREKIIGDDSAGRRAQELYKGDPEKDRAEKMTAYNLLMKTLGVEPSDGFDQMAKDYYATYDKKTAESITEADPAPDYARKGIPHIYNRLPDGRVSSMEMKDLDFIELSKEIAAQGGKLDQVQINLKVDGAGIRFGRDQSGQPFFMTSRVTQPMYANDVGSFARYAQSKNQDQQQLSRTKLYDNALDLIVNSNFIRALPKDTIVQAEMLYTPMAQTTPDGLKFVNIPYDPKHLGSKMTLIPIMAKEYSTGKLLKNQEGLLKKLSAMSDADIKIMTNKLDHSAIDVSKIVEPVIGLDPKNRQANREILDRARQQLSQAILTSPNLQGKEMLGSNIEGLVLNFPSGKVVKITTPQMKTAMAAKTASGEFGSTKTRTAVVAIGNFAGHRGHEQLINFAIERAQQEGGTPFIFVGHKVGPDDPIDIKTKLETLQRLFPGVSISVVENQTDAAGNVTVGNIFKKIEYELIKKPPFYNNIILTVGSDQVSMEKRAQQMQSRFTTFAPLAHVRVSAYITPRKAEAGGTGISTTDLRNALKTMPEPQAFQTWSRAYNVDKLGDDWIRHLMDIARRNMRLPQKPVTGKDLASEAATPAQQAAIAISMKQAGKKPKNEDEIEERFQLPKRLGTRRDRFKSLRKEAAKDTGPKFTGYFKGQDKPPVGKRLVGETDIEPGDYVRTHKMGYRGIVESVELYRPFGELAVYFRTEDDQLLRTPLSNVFRIPVSEAVAGDANFDPAGEYKNYPLYVTLKPWRGKFIAVTEIGRQEYKEAGATRELALQAIRDRIDFLLNAQRKVEASASIDFNKRFVTDILASPREKFFAKIANVGGQPKLVIAGNEMLTFGRELAELGFKPSALRIDPENPDATPLPGIGYTKNQISGLGLIANGRYVIGNMQVDSDGNKIFDLKYDSTVHTKSDKLRLNQPALTVGTRRSEA